MSNDIHDEQRLRELQALPLERKIGFTAARITEWYHHYNGHVHVSFSGGKDSTVLLYIARKLFPEIRAMFIDTGMEYPEIRNFVKTVDNVDWVRPEKTFLQVIREYGYPVVSKEVAHYVYYARRNGVGWSAAALGLIDDFVSRKGEHWNIRKGGRYDVSRWKFLVDAPFLIGDECCTIMKKKPAKKYAREHKSYSMIATMTEESRLRSQTWIKNGCNAFDAKEPKSTPMAFWTEQDVLTYIQKMHIPIASVYGDIVQTVDRGGAYNDRMHVLHVWRSQGQMPEQIPADVLHASQAVELLHQPARFERGAGLHPRSLRAGTGSVLRSRTKQ